jgi:predicted Rossmann fold flavoprotein
MTQASKRQAFDLFVVGGGAAGYFAALRAASVMTNARVCILESGRKALEKVKISGGGRCNVTHACFEPKELIGFYPRGAKELRGAFHTFQPKDTVQWFESRGVQLKTEDDGRMFPVTDTSSTILDCFERERLAMGVDLYLGTGAVRVKKGADGFEVTLSDGQTLETRALLLASGSSRTGHELARSLGHTITPLAPSLFTFNCTQEDLRELAGVAAERVKATLLIEGKAVAVSDGPLLVTHWGLSGPAVLKLSAWAARELEASKYNGILRIDWCPSLKEDALASMLLQQKESHARKLIAKAAPALGLPLRLWEFLVRNILGDEGGRPWGHLRQASLHALVRKLRAYELKINGKGQFKEEFVTCGGVELSEVDFRSMESKLVPGLFFAGEILDIDGVTGGFNFQSAWTTGWIAGSSIGERLGG